MLWDAVVDNTDEKEANDNQIHVLTTNANEDNEVYLLCGNDAAR